ncbi:hypothetical protein SDC9_164095 [bioreactor metagenome]|uniref:Uncharacterized protein n=1 Tax=bioreactor metagenome TaxID=1076179 RepID=A0A645FS83_9ZZZZ
MVEHQHANNRYYRDRQRREKKAVAQATGTFFALLLRPLMIASQLYAAETGDQRQDDHRNTDGNMHRALVAKQRECPVAKQKQYAVYAPKQTSGEATRVRFILPGHDGHNQ